MALSLSFCHPPTSQLMGPRVFKQKTSAPTLFSVNFSAFKSIFNSGFVSKKVLFGREGVSNPKTMDGLIPSSASRERSDDEGLSVLEQESFIGNRSPESGSKLEVESALNRLSKWLVSALFGSLILWRHDPEALWFTEGAVLNSILSVVLKRILNQQRPVPTLKSDPGMPSSHAQSIFFIVTFAILSSLETLGTNEFTIIVSGLALAFGSYLSWLRVSQQLHTVSQVVVGACLGLSFSSFWYWFWHSLVRDAFNSFLWVKLIVVSGAAVFCLCFLIYVIRNWLRDE